MPYVGRQPSAVPVTADDIPANSIDASKIIDGAIAVADVADNAITDAKIADATIVNLKSGRKNLIINGGFDVWQRGTSFSTGDKITADRWKKGESGGANTVSRVAFTVGQTDVPSNPKYFLRLDTTTGNDAARIEQKVEDVTINAGQTNTISFYAKGTNPAQGHYSVRVQQNFGSGGSAAVQIATPASDFTVSSSWQKFTITITLPSVSGKTIATDSYTNIILEQEWTVDSGSSAWTLDLSNVQLELGSVATDFEHRSYGEELALCQRYYEASDFIYLSPYTSGSGIANFSYAVEKRVTPTLTVVGPSYPGIVNGTGNTRNSYFYLPSTPSGHYAKYVADAEL